MKDRNPHLFMAMCTMLAASGLIGAIGAHRYAYGERIDGLYAAVGSAILFFGSAVPLIVHKLRVADRWPGGRLGFFLQYACVGAPLLLAHPMGQLNSEMSRPEVIDRFVTTILTMGVLGLIAIGVLSLFWVPEAENGQQPVEMERR